MVSRIFGWDLPPGCSASDIPGNRPEDEDWEEIYDNFWDKERLTKTHIGLRITDKEYELMDKLYSGKYSEIIDDYIIAALEYGMEIGIKQGLLQAEENRYFEQLDEDDEYFERLADEYDKELHNDLDS
jgi:hypothetical protein